MYQFILSVRSEFYKSRKTLALWSSAVLPAVICGIIAAGYFANSAALANVPGETQWVRFIGSIMGVMGTLLVPVYVVFVAYSVNSIEHRADMWKSLFALPLNRWSIYASKYVFAVTLIAICLVLFCSLLLASGSFLGSLKPELKFQEFGAAGIVVSLHLKLFLSALGILSIQFLFSLLWSDFLKPMGIGFLGSIIGLISANSGWEYAYTIPYAHPALAIMGTRTKGSIPEVTFLTSETYLSVIVAAVAFVLGYYIVSRKSIR